MGILRKVKGKELKIGQKVKVSVKTASGRVIIVGRVKNLFDRTLILVRRKGTRIISYHVPIRRIKKITPLEE